MSTPDFVCVGSALWDIIASTGYDLPPGGDVPGIIRRHPGGVALNIALALAGRGHKVAMVSALGRDSQGQRLTALMASAGIDTALLTFSDLPTDSYLAMESRGELIGAVADCQSLEQMGARILAPLADGGLPADYAGQVVIDGNLPVQVLQQVVALPTLARARLALVPASPGKAARLAQVIAGFPGKVFVNKAEADIILGRATLGAEDAARALFTAGCKAAIVTDGPRCAAVANSGGCVAHTPTPIAPRRATGAGDAFLAGYLSAGDCSPAVALDAAIAAAIAHMTKADT